MSSIDAHGYLRQVLAQDERVLFLSRQHWLVLWGHIVGEVLFALVVIGLVALVQFYMPDQPKIAYGYLIALLALPRLVWNWLSWSNRACVVTSRRVMQISGVLTKEVIDSLLEKVNDTRTDQSFFGRIFDYGDIEILTASEAGKNEFKFIARPNEFKRAILDAKESLERGPH